MNTEQLLKYYIAQRRAYAVKTRIDWDERAVRQVLQSSDVWTAWVQNNAAPKPRVYRIDLAKGFVDDNLIIGTASDAKDIRHFQREQKHDDRFYEAIERARASIIERARNRANVLNVDFARTRGHPFCKTCGGQRAPLAWDGSYHLCTCHRPTGL